MKFYDPQGMNDHKIKVTFQIDEYKGSVIYEMGGNCRGGSLLRDEASDLIDRVCWIDNEILEVDWDEDGGGGEVRLTLKNENGDVEEFIIDFTDLDDFIVAMEIIDYTPEDKS